MKQQTTIPGGATFNLDISSESSESLAGLFLGLITSIATVTTFTMNQDAKHVMADHLEHLATKVGSTSDSEIHPQTAKSYATAVNSVALMIRNLADAVEEGLGLDDAGGGLG